MAPCPLTLPVSALWQLFFNSSVASGLATLLVLLLQMYTSSEVVKLSVPKYGLIAKSRQIVTFWTGRRRGLYDLFIGFESPSNDF